jgi:hypothetical protein
VPWAWSRQGRPGSPNVVAGDGGRRLKADGLHHSVIGDDPRAGSLRARLGPPDALRCAAPSRAVGQFRTQRRSHQLEVYDARSLRALGTAPAGAGPTHMEGGADDRLYVVDTLGGAVLVFTALPRPALVERAVAPGRLYGIALDSTRRVSG